MKGEIRSSLPKIILVKERTVEQFARGVSQIYHLREGWNEVDRCMKEAQRGNQRGLRVHTALYLGSGLRDQVHAFQAIGTRDPQTPYLHPRASVEKQMVELRLE